MADWPKPIGAPGADIALTIYFPNTPEDIFFHYRNGRVDGNGFADEFVISVADSFDLTRDFEFWSKEVARVAIVPPASETGERWELEVNRRGGELQFELEVGDLRVETVWREADNLIVFEPRSGFDIDWAGFSIFVIEYRQFLERIPK